jgi:hypothetical protein
LLSGVDSLLISASASAVPDVIALAATESGDGIVDIPGIAATGAFAIASINAGAEATISVSADTGSATLPVALTLCHTDPTSGQCLAAAASSVSLPINTGGTPTFSVFAKASGKIVLAPGSSRIFVRFKDSSGTIRGETSVALQTQ